MFLYIQYWLLNFRQKKTSNSKKYGVSLIQFTHAPNTVIHTSTKVDGELNHFYIVLFCCYTLFCNNTNKDTFICVHMKKITAL